MRQIRNGLKLAVIIPASIFLLVVVLFYFLALYLMSFITGISEFIFVFIGAKLSDCVTSLERLKGSMEGGRG